MRLLSILIYLHLQLSSSVLISLQLSSFIFTDFPLSHLSRTILIIFHFIYFLSAGNLRIAPIAPVLFFPNHFCPGALLWFETVSGIRSDCDLEMVCCILQNFAKVTEMKIIAAAQQPPINNWAQDWGFMMLRKILAWDCPATLAGTHESTGILTWNM